MLQTEQNTDKVSNVLKLYENKNLPISDSQNTEFL